LPSIRKSSGFDTAVDSDGIAGNSTARGGDSRSQHLGHQPWLLGNLLFAKANHREASRPQVQIAGSIVLERLTPTVISVAVGFHDQAPIAPEKIDEMRSDTDVDLWRRQPMTPTKLKEGTLEIAASTVTVRAGPNRQAEDLRLAYRPTQFLRRGNATKIRDGSGGTRNRYATAPRHIRRQKRWASVQADALAFGSTGLTGDRDVHRPINRCKKTP
jgi:hypothetical protein